MALAFEYSIGETIKVCLDAVGDDISIIETVQAQLRRATGSSRIIDPNAILAAEFEVVERAAVGGDPAGWDLIIDAAVSAELLPGHYLTDAKLTLIGGEVLKTSPLSINLVPAVTRP